jgi:hypothetical protein
MPGIPEEHRAWPRKGTGGPSGAVDCGTTWWHCVYRANAYRANVYRANGNERTATRAKETAS